MKYPGVQKIIDILNTVDNSPESQMGFDMAQWHQNRKYSGHPCGTACCIAGWAQAQVENSDLQHPVDVLIEFCELENCENSLIWDLVSPDFSENSDLNNVKLSDLTLTMALKVLEIFRDTGEVKWHEVVSDSL